MNGPPTNREARRRSRLRDLGELDEIELRAPDFVTVLKVVWISTRDFARERPGQIIGSSFILLMLWGQHGGIEWLRYIWPAWHGPGTDPATRPKLLPGIPWDHELISFVVGALLVVGVPMLIIKFVYRESWADYGLGLPPPGRRMLAVWTFITLTAASVGPFWLGSQDAEMRQLYPFFRKFSSWSDFALYELTYLLFFVSVEFVFRGYLLFGLAGVRDREVGDVGGGSPGRFYFHKYALLIQMLSYTAWHLGKPQPELWGTLFWGLPAGATAYASRSIWPVVVSHWLLNVFLDGLILGFTFPSS